MYRIGIGSDTHRLVEGRPLILGGVKIPAARGCLGHSDADALVHAIADAILGAASEGDLGQHFPNNDPQWKDADSTQLLSHVLALVGKRQLSLVNLDSTITLEAPRLGPYIKPMRESLAKILGLPFDCVSVKAKTGEGLDAVGQGLAVTVQAVVLMTKD